MLNEAESCGEFLRAELARRMDANPRYSQRAFAKHLQMSPGELSEVLRGQRALSLRSALKAARALGLTEREASKLMRLSELERSRKYGIGADSPQIQNALRDLRERRLEMDIFHVVSDWYCFSILSLADCTGFRPSATWIASRLGITQLQASVALERLERVGLIERKQGQLTFCRDYVISGGEIPSQAVRNFHRQMLGKAIEAIETQAPAERELSGVGFAVDPRHLKAIKQEISEFLDRIVEKYSSGKKTEVYQLETALFRLTQDKR